MEKRLRRVVRFGPLWALLFLVVVWSGCEEGSVLTEPDAENLALEHGAAGKADGDVIPGQYIVVFKDGVRNPRSQAQGLARRHGAALLYTYEAALPGFAARMSAQAAQALLKNPNVAYVEPDRVVALAPPCGTPKGGPCGDPGDGGGGSSQTTPWGITRVGGPGATPSGRAFVIDSGIDLDHADLTVDLSCSANFVTKGKDSPDDGHGHGTHVAGTIAAIDNDIDVVGVAPGATLCAVRVLDNSGSGSYSGVIAGVNFVAQKGKSGDVANMSLGGPPSQALDNAITTASARVKFSIAAGNDGDDASNYSPARVNGSNIYTISAINSNDCLTSWSNWGDPVDYAAPGASILSTRKGGGTTTMSGTSMAAPHAAGILLLGSASTDGTACGDNDGSADPIIHN